MLDILAEEKSKGSVADRNIAKATMLVAELGEESACDSMIQFLPREGRFTLGGALTGHVTFDVAQDDLFRLLCWLRMGPNGCDGKVVKDHLKVRQCTAGKITKWQNLVNHQIALMNLADKMPKGRQSRQEGWVRNAEEQRKKHGVVSLPSNLSMCRGQIVAVKHEQWRVGLILSVWRVYKKGNGTQLASSEISRGSVACLRVVLMEPKSIRGDEVEEVEGASLTYSCTLASGCILVTLESVGMRLDADQMETKRGSDGLQITFPEDCFSMRVGLKLSFSITNG